MDTKMKAERFERLIRVATNSDANVLIVGPTGSGKTTLAREIHERSSRKTGPFVSVNLATLHEGTIESELFGHEKGAFTGADHRRTGKLALANGGTVFLDEIGELAPRLQGRLLDFLQNRMITPLGCNSEIKLDVRVIAATHCDLKKMIEAAKFREDLFHRLRVVAIELQPLRRQCEKLDEIVHRCLEDVCVQTRRKVLKISESVVRRIETYEWPGNYRELRNVLEYAVNATEDLEIKEGDLPDWFVEKHEVSLENIGALIDDNPLDYYGATSRFEKLYLEKALRAYHGRINQTARRIGMNKTTLIRRIRALNLKAALGANLEEIASQA